MIDFICVFCSVFINKSKTWTAYQVLYPRLFAQGFNKCGFPCTHFTIKSKYPVILKQSGKHSGGLINCFGAYNNKFHNYQMYQACIITSGSSISSIEIPPC